MKNALLLLSLGALALPGPSARADNPAERRSVEPWTNPRLNVTDGLLLWLDAARQPAARKAHGRPPLLGGQPLDIWYDGSGHGHHLLQGFPAARPLFLEVGELALVRFDGMDDCLSTASGQPALDELTVVLLAAPKSNAGGFRAFLALNETGKNDYTTGLTIDQSAAPTSQFVQLNVEGKGFGGALNLMRGGRPFREFHVQAVRIRAGRVQLIVDGKQEGQRIREGGSIRLDQITLGARFYSNTADAPCWTGFLQGDLAEVLLYQRALSDAELSAIGSYLQEKAVRLNKSVAAQEAGSAPLVPVSNPPPVQMLVPGFTVRELPISLSNINNVRYRADGKLVALAYDGKVYLLSDPRGTGLEDRVETFWENADGSLRAPIGMALTPPGYKHGNGVFVACKSKLTLLVDSKGTGKADKEIMVASGWKELQHGVDALGVAMDRDGNLYFGLGTADFTNAYQVDRSGKAHYDLASERGTILKVSPDFKTRSIVCTGIRFPVGLAFNRYGDLFATDQEGATWLPNGNPFDELLHIQPGRHYGFPPRHPKHLPGVIDEPSVFDYGPQHQSTCGLVFNEPGKATGIFGPRWWEGDALITGYSRGKLYRTRLIRTESGYVAQNQLLAALNMLAVDCCVSPGGDLVVAVHSGQPDWGSGPAGKGKLYKITYADSQTPQPVLAWAAGPREVRIAFDRPLEPANLTRLLKRTRIEYGKYVQPGDRFESLQPGYAAVQMQLASPRHALPVQSVQVTGDRRMLLLATAPQTRALAYAITLPGRDSSSPIDLAYDLGGVQTEWRADDQKLSWSGWLPHVDLTVARAFTQQSAAHEVLWKTVEQPGQLSLRCRVDLWQMLRPAVQPGSRLDYFLPPEEVTLVLESPDQVIVHAAASISRSKGRVLVKTMPKENEPLELRVSLPTGRGIPILNLSYFSSEDKRPRALPLRRFLLPWAVVGPVTTEQTLPQDNLRELRGGSWARGRAIFFGEQALCSRCHQIGGSGGKIGPDLSNLVHRDYASVVRDIREPSAAINPDFISHRIDLKNGLVLTGVVRGEGGKLIVGDQEGKEHVLAPGDIESLVPLPTSTMPEGLEKILGPDQMRDLLTFLLTEPLEPAKFERQGAPVPRSRAEVEKALAGSAAPPAKVRPLRILLAAGPKDHGPGEHDYPLWQRRWRVLLSLAPGVTVDEALGWPSPEQLRRADVLVMYSHNPGWTADKAKDLDAFLDRGGGLVFIHYAIDGHAAGAALAQRIGLTWKDGQARFRHGALEVDFTGARHPITRGLQKVRFVDESYWNLHGDAKSIEVLGTGIEEGKSWPLFWTRTQGKGRVFVSVPGHYTWTFDDPLFRLLLLRGIAWTAGESPDRFNELVLIGARVSDKRP
jgi:putative heme-binding domain-containing protein